MADEIRPDNDEILEEGYTEFGGTNTRTHWGGGLGSLQLGNLGSGFPSSSLQRLSPM